MSDNLQDLNLFVKRYSEKVISFEEDTTSDNVVNPFFKNDKSPEELKKHIWALSFDWLKPQKIYVHLWKAGSLRIPKMCAILLYFKLFKSYCNSKQTPTMFARI